MIEFVLKHRFKIAGVCADHGHYARNCGLLCTVNGEEWRIVVTNGVTMASVPVLMAANDEGHGPFLVPREALMTVGKNDHRVIKNGDFWEFTSGSGKRAHTARVPYPDVGNFPNVRDVAQYILARTKCAKWIVAHLDTAELAVLSEAMGQESLTMVPAWAPEGARLDTAKLDALGQALGGNGLVMFINTDRPISESIIPVLPGEGGEGCGLICPISVGEGDLEQRFVSEAALLPPAFRIIPKGEDKW